MVTKAKNSLLEFFSPLFQLASYLLVWASFAFIAWTLIKDYIGDGLVDGLSSIVSM